MFKRVFVLLALLTSVFLTGCASVPMASDEEDMRKKEFLSPSVDKAGLYIYRNSTFGGALKKSVFIDGELLGETAPRTYFYKQLSPGEHKISTESEFGNNDLVLQLASGKNYFIRQYIKMGLFVGGANLEMMPEEIGKQGVLECKLAQ